MFEQQQIPSTQAEIPRSVVEELHRNVVAKISRTRLGGRAHDGYNSHHPHELEDAAAAAVAVVVAAGWRPPAREITSHEELDALPIGAVVMDSPYPEGDVHQRTGDGLWAGFDGLFTTRVLCLPAVLLLSQTEKAGTE